MINTIKASTHTNKSYNEDLFNSTINAVWVLDGATGVYKNSVSDKITDAQWYVKEIDKNIKMRISDTTKSLKIILKESMNSAFEIYKKLTTNNLNNNEAYPSASIVIVRELNNYIEYLSIGDCTLLLKVDNHIIRILDDTVPNLDKIVINEMQKLMTDKNITLAEARIELNDLFLEHRALKNTINGYWILEFDKKAIEHSLYGKIKSSTVTEIAIMSDGYYRLRDTFNAYDSDEELINDLKSKSCMELFENITKFENGDENCIKYPRGKKCDDITIVYIQII